MINRVLMRSQHGFSLLETLVAFAILVLVLAVIFQVFGSGSRSARLAHDYAEATAIAQSKLAGLQAGDDSEMSGIAQQRYHWQLQRDETNYTDPGTSDRFQTNYKLYDLNVLVVWQSSGKQRQVELNTVGLVKDKDGF